MIQNLESFVSVQMTGAKIPENVKAFKMVTDGVSFIESWGSYFKYKDHRLSQFRRNFQLLLYCVGEQHKIYFGSSGFYFRTA